MKTIPLTQSQVALVDDEDYPWISQFEWYTFKNRRISYAVRNGVVNGKRRTILMHRVIMNTPKGMQVDHMDHNGVNNQKGNMRNCTGRQNAENMRNQSRYGVGVVRELNPSLRKPFRVRIRVGENRPSLGMFATAEEAQWARRKFFGERR